MPSCINCWDFITTQRAPGSFSFSQITKFYLVTQSSASFLNQRGENRIQRYFQIKNRKCSVYLYLIPRESLFVCTVFHWYNTPKYLSYVSTSFAHLTTDPSSNNSPKISQAQSDWRKSVYEGQLTSTEQSQSNKRRGA